MPITYYTEEEYDELKDRFDDLERELEESERHEKRNKDTIIFNYLKGIKEQLNTQNATKWRKKIEEDYIAILRTITKC